MSLIIYGITITGSSLLLYSQENIDTIKYSESFKFRDGIYLYYDQVRMNNPVPKARIVSSTEYNDKAFFKNLLAGNTISYYDDRGIRYSVEKDSIWGFTDNGIIWVQIEEHFDAISTVGTICHFISEITISDNSNYRFSDRVYQPINRYLMDPTAIYDPYARIYYMSHDYYQFPERNKPVTKLYQLLMDFNNGTIMEFNIESTELLLKKDNTLYTEFTRLSNKKKNELMFSYIRKFNERNPLYIPVGKSSP